MTDEGLSTRSAALLFVLAGCVGPALAQQASPPEAATFDPGAVVSPDIHLAAPTAAGAPARTNIELLLPEKASPYGGNFFETPASLACAYRRVPVTQGCRPHRVKAVATGGSKTIAIVTVGDNPNIAANLSVYSSQFGLPPADVGVVFASGTRPPSYAAYGWNVQAAASVELAHALAPDARIVLVEAASDGLPDLVAAVDVASGVVTRAGGGEVEIGWSFAEFDGEAAYESHFTAAGVVYFAASGDVVGAQWPAASANVVAVGGTSLSRVPATGVFFDEATWSQIAGGPSAYIASPPYQAGVAAVTGPMRAVPDIAADANPLTGALVFSFAPRTPGPAGWMVVGGTTVSTAIATGLANASGTFRPSSAAELGQIYANAAQTPSASGLRPITTGVCGPYAGERPTPPWNACVGLGSPVRSGPF